MPSIFTDEVGSYDLAMLNSGNFTTGTSVPLPNGDGMTYGVPQMAGCSAPGGADFDFGDGTAWSIEFWHNTGAITVTETIVCNGNPGVGPGAASWVVQNIGSSDVINFSIMNTSSIAYMSVSTPYLSPFNIWRYIVFVKESGAQLRCYVNAAASTTSTSVAGTARVPGADSRIYFGSSPDLTNDMGTDSDKMKIAKLAIYNRQLGIPEMLEHYSAMVAI